MMPKWEELTPKQQAAAKKLQIEIAKRSFVFGLGQGALLFLMNVANIIINLAFVKSDDFVFFMSIVSAILVISNLAKWPKSQQEYISAEVKKILDSKDEE